VSQCALEIVGNIAPKLIAAIPIITLKADVVMLFIFHLVSVVRYGCDHSTNPTFMLKFLS